MVGLPGSSGGGSGLPCLRCEYQAFRAIDLARRLGYRLDQKVQAFVRSRVQQSTAEEFVTAVQKHRPEMAKEEISRMCSQYVTDTDSDFST